jgi:hypothetical protein
MDNLNKEIEQNENKIEIHPLFVYVSDEAMNLQVAENFLVAVQRRFLLPVKNSFDLENFKNILNQIKKMPPEITQNEYQRVKSLILKELDVWHKTLAEQNEQIETYHFRRFCDAPEQKLDIIVFAALTRFYRKLPHSSSNQSKYDLFVTRLFTKDSGSISREVLLDRQELTNHLVELFDAWNSDSDSHFNESIKIDQNELIAVEGIEQFLKEVKLLIDFEDLIKSDLFERYRTFKHSLGEMYFRPAVTAVAIECNLAMGNAFAELLSNANEPLGEKLDKFDFAGAFHDTSPESQVHTSKLLNDIRLRAEKPENEEMLHIWTLLELVSSKNEPKNNLSEKKEILDESDITELPTAQERLFPYLLTLSQPQPDTNLLLGYLQKSKSLADIDLNDFLGSDKKEINELSRNVLGMILWTEEVCTHELSQPKEISPKVKLEVKQLFQKSHNYYEKLEGVLAGFESDAPISLLNVTNKLVEAQLKLKHSIVRLSNRNLLGKNEPAGEAIEKEPQTDQVKNQLPQTSQKHRTNRWLIAATFLVAIFCGIVFMFEQYMTGTISGLASVNKVDVSKLPKGKHLQEAYQNKDTLFITALDSWETMPKEEQQESLNQLLNHPSKTKLKTIVVANGKGRLLGDVSADDKKLAGKKQIAGKK